MMRLILEFSTGVTSVNYQAFLGRTQWTEDRPIKRQILCLLLLLPPPPPRPPPPSYLKTPF
jgi:hypothetical protein